jgi:predicted metalloprotease with PDZ domain
MRTLRTLLLVVVAASASAQTIRIRVDATDAPHKKLHAHLVIPVKAGPLTLYYPEWIPGEHGPTGPVMNLTGLVFTANGTALRWMRDPVDMYALHVDVPSGVTTLDVDLDYLDPVSTGQFSAGGSLTPRLGLISWNAVLLYPAAKTSDELTYDASLRLPSGWKYATALTTTGTNGDEIHFEPISLTHLIDSPVLAGVNLKRVSLPSSSPFPHTIDIASDSDAAMITPDDFAASYGRLVDEARAIYGAEHFRHYDWLVTLSDSVEHFGLEHHESSDDRTVENELDEEQRRRDLAGLLAHEYSHSWNGKYRRPAGLATPNYDGPMKGELLWVYEGLTQYLGKLLPYRSGLWTAEYYRESAALMATNLINHGAGRAWRPLEDTAVAAQILYGSPEAWRAARRSTDFYDEGFLLWLDTDMTIRKLTSDKKSLDDFLRHFYGGNDGDPILKPYTFDDVVKALNDVVANDWAGFLNQRLRSTTNAPLGGFETSGWRLVYNETPNMQQKAIEDRDDDMIDVSNSLGFWVDHGRVTDVIPNTPAAKAGIVPGSMLIGVNGRRYSPRMLRNFIRDSKTATGPMQLVFAAEDFVNAVSVDYHDGLRYPHLERIPSSPDWLTELGKPRASGGQAPSPVRH